MVNQIKDVQPIRDKRQLKDMEWALERFCGQRDLIFFKIGVTNGLRCSDILKIKTEDILKLRNKRNKIIKIAEKKTTKKREINFSVIWIELIKYADTVKSEWLFPSRKGDKPITVTQAYRQLNKAAEFAGVDHIGTHTMRKTFGYWYYIESNHDIATLQTILNHSAPSITLKYIGITDEKINNSLENFNPFV